MKTKGVLLNLLIRETSPFLCYERLLNMTYVAYKKCIFREMQFWSHCYTVVSYQALFRQAVCKIPAVNLSGAKNVCVCTKSDFGSLTSSDYYVYCMISGRQETEIVCKKRKTNIVVTDANCDPEEKPRVQTVTCNTKPCPPL